MVSGIAAANDLDAGHVCHSALPGPVASWGWQGHGWGMDPWEDPWEDPWWTWGRVIASDLRTFPEALMVRPRP